MNPCNCYQIGGPFIAEDPDCPYHGSSGTSEREALYARIAELEAEVGRLKAVSIPPRPKRVYGQLNPLAEVERLTCILKNDPIGGLQNTIIAAKKLKTLYLEASLKTRQKFSTRSYPYRFSYLESAYSARHLLRTRLLETIDATT